MYSLWLTSRDGKILRVHRQDGNGANRLQVRGGKKVAWPMFVRTRIGAAVEMCFKAAEESTCLDLSAFSETLKDEEECWKPEHLSFKRTYT